MSRQKKIEDISVGELSEDSITEYLENHLDFFEGRENLLMNLQLSHHQGSGAISLVERQVEVLRESNLKFKQQLKEIVVAAKDNHKVLDKIHQLALRLIESPSSVKRIQILQSSLKKDFLADRCVLIIFSSKVKSVFSDNDFTTFIDPSDKRLSPFESFLLPRRLRRTEDSVHRPSHSTRVAEDAMRARAVVTSGSRCSSSQTSTLLARPAMEAGSSGRFWKFSTAV